MNISRIVVRELLEGLQYIYTGLSTCVHFSSKSLVVYSSDYISHTTLGYESISGANRFTLNKKNVKLLIELLTGIRNKDSIVDITLSNLSVIFSCGVHELILPLENTKVDMKNLPFYPIERPLTSDIDDLNGSGLNLKKLGNIHMELSADTLINALKFVKSEGSDKIYFTDCEVFSTNKYLLKFAKIKCIKYTENCEFIIDTKHLDTIIKSFEKSDTLSIEKTNNYAIFRSEYKELKIMHSFGRLPNIYDLLPSESDLQSAIIFDISRNDLNTLVKKAYMANKKGGIVHFNEDGTFAISVNGLNNSITEGENKKSARLRATQLKELLSALNCNSFKVALPTGLKTYNVSIFPDTAEFVTLLTPILYDL
jgi:DNA polymerase III sliding clamp (beta) subunit (PCNA family)